MPADIDTNLTNSGPMLASTAPDSAKFGRHPDSGRINMGKGGDRPELILTILAKLVGASRWLAASDTAG